jgi:hypothetical protein
MPKIKNLAALAAAVEAARRYARSNPDKAAHYLDQAAAFLDKQTKGKYSGQVNNVVGKVKSAAGLPQGTQGYETNAGYGAHPGYGGSSVAPDPLTTTAPSTTPPSAASTSSASTTPSTSVPPVDTSPLSETADPLGTGDRRFPGSKDL